MPSASVPETAKQAHDTRDPRQWTWVEPTVWTERMLAALVNGVKGGKWYSLMGQGVSRRDAGGVLAKAWRDNNGAAGVDGQSVERFAAQAERYLDELAAAAGGALPASWRAADVHPQGGGRTRPLGIPTVKDRIVQGAVKRVLEPIFEWEFLDVSYGFRPGRGCKDALREVDRLHQGRLHLGGGCRPEELLRHDSACNAL